MAQPWRKIVYAHNNWPGTVWVPHLSKRIHSISAKIKSNIPWIVRKVLMAKVKMYSLQGQYIASSYSRVVYCVAASKNIDTPLK
jgi:hypothetical protein